MRKEKFGKGEIIDGDLLKPSTLERSINTMIDGNDHEKISDIQIASRKHRKSKPKPKRVRKDCGCK